MEAYLEFTLFALLNYHEMEWPENLESVDLSNYLAITLVGLTCVLPVVLFFWMCCNRKKWGDEKFGEKYGSYLDGMQTEKVEHQAIVLLSVSVFFIRRMFVCLTLVYWQDFLWG
mmetsp:Transcript_15593/g.18531  ORF Transcript_15593/g.18531 Transcript_15593/m.18531 type:complete len:114 (-) Transcript_15593:698-1039(-)